MQVRELVEKIEAAARTADSVAAFREAVTKLQQALPEGDRLLAAPLVRQALRRFERTRG